MIHDKINNTIGVVTDLVKNLKMISINASISASKIGSGTGAVESKTFDVISVEIQNISDRALLDIQSLGDVADEIKQVSTHINMAGSLRMLSQKLMKDFLLSKVSEEFSRNTYMETKTKFINVLRKVEQSDLNSTLTYNQIDTIRNSFNRFVSSLEEEEDMERASTLNMKLLSKLQELVMMYEELS